LYFLVLYLLPTRLGLAGFVILYKRNVRRRYLRILFFLVLYLRPPPGLGIFAIVLRACSFLTLVSYSVLCLIASALLDSALLDSAPASALLDSYSDSALCLLYYLFRYLRVLRNLRLIPPFVFCVLPIQEHIPFQHFLGNDSVLGSVIGS